MNIKTGTILSIIMLSFLIGHTQTIALDRQAAIDSIIQQYAKEYSIVGLSVGIVDNGEKTTIHYGQTDQDNERPITDSTMFLLSSISKLYTATAIMQLVEKKQLDLEDRLVDVLPNFKMKDKRHSAIKIKHLLTHSSGLMWDNKLEESPDDITSTPLYIQNLQKKKLKFTPGEKMSYKTYSNVGYDLLGAVVERISGQGFDEYVDQNILQPLKMSQSTYFYEDIDSSKLAIPQIVAGDSKAIRQLNFFGKDSKKDPIVNGQPLALKSYHIYGEDYEHNPSGNLISSSHELNLWIQHHLELSSTPAFEGILKQSTLNQMWSTQKAIPNQNTSIGWGWWIHQDDELGESVFHVGNNPGFCSILMIYPSKNFGITVLCNGWYAQEAVWNKITKAIVKLYIGE